MVHVFTSMTLFTTFICAGSALLSKHNDGSLGLAQLRQARDHDTSPEEHRGDFLEEGKYNRNKQYPLSAPDNNADVLLATHRQYRYRPLLVLKERHVNVPKQSQSPVSMRMTDARTYPGYDNQRPPVIVNGFTVTHSPRQIKLRNADQLISSEEETDAPLQDPANFQNLPVEGEHFEDPIPDAENDVVSPATFSAPPSPSMFMAAGRPGGTSMPTFADLPSYTPYKPYQPTPNPYRQTMNKSPKYVSVLYSIVNTYAADDTQATPYTQPFPYGVFSQFAHLGPRLIDIQTNPSNVKGQFNHATGTTAYYTSNNPYALGEKPVTSLRPFDHKFELGHYTLSSPSGLHALRSKIESNPGTSNFNGLPKIALESRTRNDQLHPYGPITNVQSIPIDNSHDVYNDPKDWLEYDTSYSAPKHYDSTVKGSQANSVKA